MADINAQYIEDLVTKLYTYLNISIGKGGELYKFGNYQKLAHIYNRDVYPHRATYMKSSLFFLTLVVATIAGISARDDFIGMSVGVTVSNAKSFNSIGFSHFRAT